MDPADGDAFFKVDQNTGVFKITDKNGLLRNSVSRYKIKLFLEV